MIQKKTAFCPYYITQGERSVTCTGITSGPETRQRYETARKKENWYSCVCCSEKYGKLCPVAIVLNSLLEENQPDMEDCIQLMDARAREEARKKLMKRTSPAYRRKRLRRKRETRHGIKKKTKLTET